MLSIFNLNKDSPNFPIASKIKLIILYQIKNEIFKFTDESGNIHYTNKKSKSENKISEVKVKKKKLPKIFFYLTFSHSQIPNKKLQFRLRTD